MKWTWIYITLGGIFVIKLIESSRTIALINEAQQLKQVTKKPIMLVSSNPRQGFDVYLNPNETIAWQLPYTNKAFASIVSDSLEEIPYPKQAMAEWMRVADTVLVNTHSIFSPEAWLDLRHHYVFMGQQTISIKPAINWSIAGGVGYFFYRRRRQEERKALPQEEETTEAALRCEASEAISPPSEERKALPPPPEIEPAPIISPEELSGIAATFLLPSSIKKGTVNLSIGSDEALVTELKAKGVESLVFDPQRLPQEHNRQILSQLESKPADSATLFGVLDRISDPEERKSALQVAYENVKLGGKVYIKVDEPQKYLTKVKQVFPVAKIKQGIITAVK